MTTPLPRTNAVRSHLENLYGLSVTNLTRPEAHNPFVLRVHAAALRRAWRR